MRLSILTAASLFLGLSLVGCNKPVAPTVEKVASVKNTLASKPDWKLVTLHIDGFKKSKSGGT